MRSVYALCVCGGMFTGAHPTAYGYRIRLPHTAAAYNTGDVSSGIVPVPVPGRGPSNPGTM